MIQQQHTLGRRTGRLAMCVTVAAAALTASPAHAAIITVDFSGNAHTGVSNHSHLTVSQTLPIAAGAVRVLGYAHENTGAGITIPVPEASTLLMMAFGLASVAALARRRNAAG